MSDLFEEAKIHITKVAFFPQPPNHHNEAPCLKLIGGILGLPGGEAHGSNQSTGQNMTLGQENGHGSAPNVYDSEQKLLLTKVALAHWLRVKPGKMTIYM